MHTVAFLGFGVVLGWLAVGLWLAWAFGLIDPFPRYIRVLGHVHFASGQPAAGIPVECRYAGMSSGFGDVAFGTDSAGWATSDGQGLVWFQIPVPRSSAWGTTEITAVHLVTHVPGSAIDSCGSSGGPNDAPCPPHPVPGASVGQYQEWGLATRAIAPGNLSIDVVLQ